MNEDVKEYFKEVKSVLVELVKREPMKKSIICICISVLFMIGMCICDYIIWVNGRDVTKVRFDIFCTLMAISTDGMYATTFAAVEKYGKWGYLFGFFILAGCVLGTHFFIIHLANNNGYITDINDIFDCMAEFAGAQLFLLIFSTPIKSMISCTEKVKVTYLDKYRKSTGRYRTTIHVFAYKEKNLEYTLEYHKRWKWFRRLQFTEQCYALINPINDEEMILDYFFPKWSVPMAFFAYILLWDSFGFLIK